MHNTFLKTLLVAVCLWQGFGLITDASAAEPVPGGGMGTIVNCPYNDNTPSVGSTCHCGTLCCSC